MQTSTSIKTKADNLFNWIIFWLFALLIFINPILFVTNTNELFEFPKTFFLYILGITIIFVFLIKVLWLAPKLIWPATLVLAFLAVNVIASVFSSHLYTSVWGYYTRFNGGLISTLIYFGLYVVALNTLDNAVFKRLVVFSLLTIVPISFFAFIQHFGLLWYVNPVVRAYATFGQPNWVSAYISMLLPIVLHLFLRSRDFKVNIFWCGLYLLGFATLWFTYSISGLFAYVLTTLLVLFFNRIYIVENKSVVLPKISLLFLVVIIISVTNLGLFQKKLFDVFVDTKKLFSSISMVYAQESSSVNQVSDPGFIRFGMWEGTLHLIISSPKVFFVGTGPETFPYDFQPFRVRSLNYSSEWNFILNKPHNYYLELFSQLGAAGFGVYLLLVIFSLKKLNKMLVSSLLSLLVTNVFGWPTVSTALLFWLYLSQEERSHV